MHWKGKWILKTKNLFKGKKTKLLGVNVGICVGNFVGATVGSWVGIFVGVNEGVWAQSYTTFTKDIIYRQS